MTSLIEIELPMHGGREQLVAALVPAAVEPRRCAPARLPTLPTPPAPCPSLPSGMDVPLVGAARLDRAGRLHEKILLRALGWAPGHRLDLDDQFQGVSVRRGVR